jgi:hypothetical protein
LIKLLSTADQAAIDELNVQIEELEKQVSVLDQVRKIISLRIHGKPQRAKVGRPKKAADDSAPASGRRLAVAKLLLVSGPLTREVICNRLGISGTGMHLTLDHEWFEQTMKGYSLTEAGRRAAS